MIQIIKHITWKKLILNNSWVKEEIEVEIAYYLELKTQHLSKKFYMGKNVSETGSEIAQHMIWLG